MLAPVFEGWTVSQGLGGTFDVAMPVTRPDGDLYVFFVGKYYGWDFDTIPGALTQLHLQQADSEDAWLWSGYRMGASEPASYRFLSTRTSSDGWVGVVGRISGIDASPIDDSDVGDFDATSQSTIEAPSLTTSGANRLILAAATVRYRRFTTDVPAGWSNFVRDGAPTGGIVQHLAAATMVQASAGATGTPGFRLDGGNNANHVAAAVAINPQSIAATGVLDPVSVGLMAV